MKFLIISLNDKDEFTNEPLYWNSEDGWVNKETATAFTQDDVENTVKMPLDSKLQKTYWVIEDEKQNDLIRRMTEALKLLSYGASKAVENGLVQPQVNGGLVLAKSILKEIGS